MMGPGERPLGYQDRFWKGLWDPQPLPLSYLFLLQTGLLSVPWPPVTLLPHSDRTDLCTGASKQPFSLSTLRTLAFAIVMECQSHASFSLPSGCKEAARKWQESFKEGGSHIWEAARCPASRELLMTGSDLNLR